MGPPAFVLAGVTVIGPGVGGDGLERAAIVPGTREADRGDTVVVVGVLRVKAGGLGSVWDVLFQAVESVTVVDEGD